MATLEMIYQYREKEVCKGLKFLFRVNFNIEQVFYTNLYYHLILTQMLRKKNQKKSGKVKKLQSLIVNKTLDVKT